VLFTGGRLAPLSLFQALVGMLCAPVYAPALTVLWHLLLV
jgi:hypothetical protein